MLDEGLGDYEADAFLRREKKGVEEEDCRWRGKRWEEIFIVYA